jgi:hypothetical protein
VAFLQALNIFGSPAILAIPAVVAVTRRRPDTGDRVVLAIVVLALTLVHLCRFVVRIQPFSLADFPGRRPGGFPFPNLASPSLETIAQEDLRAASLHRS